MKSTCPVCGKQIKQEKHVEGGRPKRFCSPRCRGIYHCRASQARKRGAEVGPDGHPLRPGRKCCVCGKEIDPRKVEGTVCCSDACSQKRSNRLRYGLPVGDEEFRAFCENRKAERLAKRKRVCPVCGKEFTAPVKHRGGYPTVYCSLHCRNLKNRQRYYEKLRAAGKTRPSRAKVREPRACEYCGAMFVPKQCDTKYCSKRCGAAAYVRRNREELRAKERAYRATHPRHGTHQAGRNVAASKARKAEPNITFVQKREPVERDSIARVQAYLSLPASERWAQLNTLTKKEQDMARSMWMSMKSRPVYYSAMAN